MILSLKSLFVFSDKPSWWSDSGGSGFEDAEYEVLLFFYCSVGDFWKAAGYVPGLQRTYVSKVNCRGHVVCGLDFRGHADM